MRKAKIVCTIGPASRSLDILQQLLDCGMDVARLNFSHGTLDEHAKTIALIRQAADHRGRAISVLQDLQGPRIRLGLLAPDGLRLQQDLDHSLQRSGATGAAGATGEEALTEPGQGFTNLRGRCFLQAAEQVVRELLYTMALAQHASQVLQQVGGHFGIGHGPVRGTGIRQPGPAGQGAQLVVRRRRQQAP